MGTIVSPNKILLIGGKIAKTETAAAMSRKALGYIGGGIMEKKMETLGPFKGRYRVI